MLWSNLRPEQEFKRSVLTILLTQTLKFWRQECHQLSEAEFEDHKQLVNLIDDIAGRFSIRGIVVGSGFESHYEVISALRERFEVLANQEDIYSLAAKPEDFFHLLDTHGISHPNYYPGIASLDSSFFYVCKRQGADGGSHVRFFEVGDTLSPDEYLQQYVPGLPASVTFCGKWTVL